MKNSKKTKKSALVALLMVGALAITGAFAFLSDYDSAVNKFQFLDDDGEQTIDVELHEPGWDEAFDDEDGDGKPDGDADEDGIPDFAENAIYGRSIAKAPYVENLGENDVYSFVTVLVPTKDVITSDASGVWQDSAVQELFDLQKIEGVEGTSDKWVEICQDANGNWVAAGDDSVNYKVIRNEAGTFTAHVFAYNGILKSGEKTDSLFEYVEVINLVNDQVSPDDIMNIYVNAYAVQADGQDSTDLVDLWKVVMNDSAKGGTYDVFAPLA